MATDRLVLLIEDDLALQQIMKAYFELEQIRLVVAGNGNEGIRLFNQMHPDVVVTDLRMPGMDGLEVVTTITQLSPDIPVIVMSGMGNMEDSIEALRCGAWDYLEKPCKPTDLLHAVKKGLEHLELLREKNRYRDFLEQEVTNRTEELEKELARRKIAEQSLYESEQKFRAIFDNVFHYIALIDSSGTLIELNNTAREFMREGDPKVLGRKLWEMSWWSPDQLVQDEVEKAVARASEGEFISFETKIYSENGDHLYIDFSLKPVADEKGDVKLILAEGHDVTAHKQIERELIDSKELAEAANLAKSEFLNNMSHELRTPMHWILSYSEFGIDRYADVDRDVLLSYFNEIRNGGERMMHLLGNLLDLSKMESGEMNYNIVECSVLELVNSVKMHTAKVASEANITLDVLDKSKTSMVNCDPDRVRQVIDNYISNAIKFSVHGGRIVVELSSDHKGVILRVIDEGCGVPDSELDSIFEKFFQSSTTKTGAGGTGLGLAISRDIIMAHHGSVWAEHNTPRGTILNFSLPFEE